MTCARDKNLPGLSELSSPSKQSAPPNSDPTLRFLEYAQKNTPQKKRRGPPFQDVLKISAYK